jgi:hypothetical protein
VKKCFGQLFLYSPLISVNSSVVNGQQYFWWLIVRDVRFYNHSYAPVVPKVYFSDPKEFETSSQGICGYISVMAALTLAFR